PYCPLLLFIPIPRPPPTPPPFPYTTLFRSRHAIAADRGRRHHGQLARQARATWRRDDRRGAATARARAAGSHAAAGRRRDLRSQDRKSTRLNSSHVKISYAVFCLKKKKKPR